MALGVCARGSERFGIDNGAERWYNRWSEGRGENGEMRYYVRCARCGARVRVYARRENGESECGGLRLVKCGRCRCVVGDYREGERILVWYGAKMWRV